MALIRVDNMDTQVLGGLIGAAGGGGINPSRVKGVTTAHTVTEASGTAPLAFTSADAWDVGGWHNPGASPDDEEFTCPVGADGLHFFCFTSFWDQSGGGSFEWHFQFTVNNVAVGPEYSDRIGNFLVDVTTQYSGEFELSAGDVVRLERSVISGAAASANITGTFSIRRVAPLA